MTRSEAIGLAFQIKENPEGHDFSSYLYSAVGMVKQSPDAGTAFAAFKLLEAIQDTHIPLSDFCKRKVSILEKEIAGPIARVMENMAIAAEKADIQRDMRALGMKGGF